MSLPSHERDRLRQQMAACRPDGDDLLLPEMAELTCALRQDAALRGEWERQQQSDRVIRTAMYDVSVPAGLAERILALAASADTAASCLDEKVAQAVEQQADQNAAAAPAAASRTGARRMWLVAASALVVLLIVGVRYWPAPAKEITQAELADQVAQWRKQALAVAASEWEEWDSARPHNLYPAASVASDVTPSRWTQVADRQAPGLVVFDLSTQRGTALLFAVKTPHKYLVSPIPFTTLTATGGYAVGAWQSDGVLYVIVVGDQEQRRLREIIPKAPIG